MNDLTTFFFNKEHIEYYLSLMTFSVQTEIHNMVTATNPSEKGHPFIKITLDS